MGVLISDLSPELQELVHQRQIEAGFDGKFIGNLQNQHGNFTWKNTPEGQEFWQSIQNSKDMTQDPLYPKKKDYIINDYNIY